MKTERSRPQRSGFLLHIGSLTVLASTWLVLHKLPKVAAAQQTRGIQVYLSHRCGPDFAESNRLVFLQVLSNGTIRINSEVTKEGELPSLISKIMEHRYERVLYIVADDDVPYARVVREVDFARQATRYLAPVLLPRQKLDECAEDWCVSLGSILPDDTRPR